MRSLLAKAEGFRLKIADPCTTKRCIVYFCNQAYSTSLLATVYSLYIVQDGLTGWVSAGLPLSDESDYDSGPIAEFSGVVEGRILPFLRWASLRPEERFFHDCYSIPRFLLISMSACHFWTQQKLWSCSYHKLYWHWKFRSLNFSIIILPWLSWRLIDLSCRSEIQTFLVIVISMRFCSGRQLPYVQ